MITVIPAIDLIDGKCVRLAQGDYSRKTVYNENPLEVARQFEGAGIRRLHLVDLDGARKGTVVNQKVLESIASKTNLEIDFGGGIKTDTDIQSVYNAGASLATIGSMAVRNPALFLSWVKKYGAEKILLGADVKNEKIAVSGWTEQTDILVYDFIGSHLKNGVRNIFCTDISKDGMLQGAAVALYKKILAESAALRSDSKGNSESAQTSINLIASGGIASIKDIEAVRDAGCSGVIIGKAIYEGKIRIQDLAGLR